MERGLNVGKDNIELYHLQFANDTLLFIPHDDDVMLDYRRLFECFGIMSGLKVNFDKSTIVTWLNKSEWVDQLANTIGCKVERLRMKYLGLPLGANSKSSKIWTPMLDKIKQKLSLWRSKFLSKARRLQLIQSVLSGLPLYYLSFFRMPTVVARNIIAIQTRFFWEEDVNNRKIASISWKQIKIPKNLGGLRVGLIKLKNLGMLLKWFWRLCQSEDQLWKKVVQSIHQIPNQFMTPSQLHDIKFGSFHEISKACKQFP